MNWRRGLFRLWIVFSVIWIGAFSVIGFNEYAEYKAEALRQVNNLDSNGNPLPDWWKEARKHDAPVFPTEMYKAFENLSDDQLRAAAGFPSQPSAQTNQADAANVHVVRNRIFAKTLPIAFGPPVALLIFGLGLSWALKGFRSNRT